MVHSILPQNKQTKKSINSKLDQKHKHNIFKKFTTSVRQWEKTGIFFGMVKTFKIHAKGKINGRINMKLKLKKIKNSCHIQCKKNEKGATDWKKVFTNDTFDEGLFSKP